MDPDPTAWRFLGAVLLEVHSFAHILNIRKSQINFFIMFCKAARAG